MSSKPLSFLGRLGVCRMCLRSRRGDVFLPRALYSHLVTLFRGVIGRFDLLKVVRRQALSFHQELHALVFVLPAFEVDAGLLQFLFPETGIGLLRDGQCRLLLRCRRVEGIPVIGRFDFRQQLSLAHVLALFDQHPDHPAADLEGHIGRFRTFDRTTGADRFGALHDGWSSDLNGHGSRLRSSFGFVGARCEHRQARNRNQSEKMFL